MNTNLLRADIYRILAVGFDEPIESHHHMLVSVLADLADRFDFLLPLFQAAQDAQREELEALYIRLFVTQTLVPHSEGSYQLAERGPILSDITAFYNAFQIGFVEKKGSPDSIKMELAFMSYMALKEAYADENNLLQEGGVTFEGQKTFLNDHLGRWGNLFADRLEKTTDHPYYIALAELLKKWLQMENKHFDITPVSLPIQLPGSNEEGLRCPL